MKKCSKCKIKKPIIEFRKNKTTKNGYTYYCKDCLKPINKKDRIKHKEKRREYRIKYKKNHYQEIKNKEKEYRLKNRDKLNLKSKKWRENHKTYIRNYSQKRKKRRNKYERERREKDKTLKLINAIRKRMWEVLKGKKKSFSSLKLLGCSIKQLKQHLKNQFKIGMTWENYGRGWYDRQEWQIDHIRPCASFDLSKASEQRKCFNYSNLRPLWAKENLSRSKTRRII